MKGWFGKLVGGQLVPYATMIAGAVAVTLALLLYVQTRRLEGVRAAQAGTQAALAAAEGTVATQDLALKRWQAMAESAAERKREAEARAEREAAEAAILRQRIKALMRSDEALPDCQALLDTRLDAICPGTAQAIRETAR